MKQTKVINYFSGPGCGKSTNAAYLFFKLKTAGYDVELTNEYAKWLTYEKNHKKIKNQIYLFAKQQQQIYRLIGEVDFIIMDSPLLLSAIYDESKSEHFSNLIIEEHTKLNSINFFIKRETDYQQNGRYHTSDQALEIDQRIKEFLIKNNINHIEVGLDDMDNTFNIITGK